MSKKLVELGPREQLEFDIPYEYERAQKAIEILLAIDAGADEDGDDTEYDETELKELFGIGEENRIIGLRAQIFTYVSMLLGDIPDPDQIETYFTESNLSFVREKFEEWNQRNQEMEENDLLELASPILFISLYFMIFMAKNYGAKISAAYGERWLSRYAPEFDDVHHYVTTLYKMQQDGFQFQVKLSNKKKFDPLLLAWQCCKFKRWFDMAEQQYCYAVSFDFYPWIKLFRQEFGIDLQDYGFRSPYLDAGNVDDRKAYLAEQDRVLHTYEIFECGPYGYILNEKEEATIIGSDEWTEVIRIPATLEGHPVVAIGAHAFDAEAIMEYYSFLGDIVDESQIPAKLVEQRVLHKTALSRIKEVYLPETVRFVDDFAFNYNTKLRKVHFPRGLKEIGMGAFTSADLPCVCLPKNCKVYHEEGESVWYEGGAFEACAGYDDKDEEYPVEILYYEDDPNAEKEAEKRSLTAKRGKKEFAFMFGVRRDRDEE